MSDNPSARQAELLALADTLLAAANEMLKIKPTMRGHGMGEILSAVATTHLQARALRVLAARTGDA